MAAIKENIIMIDNYDRYLFLNFIFAVISNLVFSFTYNVVEYIMALGVEDIPTYRNDQITLEELIALNPTKLVISPGPGHPLTDAGISTPAILHFAGKIPVLGVCMGQQCIFTAFGGTVSFAGEIVHGKTSIVKHDGRGIYKGVRQDIAVTRYHSLAGTHETVPEELEVTSWTADRNIVMGVRHKRYTVEGVQYHPESILSEEGKSILRNFLDIQGGTWEENEAYQSKQTPVTKSKPTVNGTSAKESILDKIHRQRLLDIQTLKATPGLTPADLQLNYSLNLAPPQISFPARISRTSPALMAEIKRASPSKGDIDITANAPSQALKYATSGASVISVLTEPTWFKGSLDDMRNVRRALDSLGESRPAVLRKDFIIDEYQILEARLAGADTILLIVAMLTVSQLEKLYAYSLSLGMEPLVEVNSAEEMEIAVKLGAKVIGVNNRNLHSFAVDLETTSKLVSLVPEGTILCALSGIASRKDVEKYVAEGVGAVLVGESLMRAKDTKSFIAELLGVPAPKQPKTEVVVKICGIKTPKAAIAAAEAGADLLGMIFVPGRKRTVSIDDARAIADAVREKAVRQQTKSEDASSTTWFDHWFQWIRSHSRRPLLVGVFQNQSLEEILAIQASVPLDIVQLHGSEPLQYASLIPCPVIRAFPLTSPLIFSPQQHAISLVDAGSTTVQGGTGEVVDWARVKELKGPVMLAGGLTPENVAKAIEVSGAVAVDVASGVEDANGDKDTELVKKFVVEAKKATTV
jgi:anthranilate synthase / indole-3-glycerol phosphate synthase / phosphoribosylanthranilate isomerase